MANIEDNTEKILNLEEFYDLIQNTKLQYKRPTLYNDLQIVPAYYKIKNENTENLTVLDYVYLQMFRGCIYNIDYDNKLIQFKYNIDDLLRYLDKLDDYNIQYIYNKRKSWINNDTDTSIEDIMGSYSKIYNEENNYIVLDVHIENWDDLSIIDQYNNEISYKQLMKLSKSHSVGSILQYIGIHFSDCDEDDEDSNEICPLFYLRQLKVYTSKIDFKNKCYIIDNAESEVEDIDINSDDDESEDLENEDLENEDLESNNVEETEENDNIEDNTIETDNAVENNENEEVLETNENEEVLETNNSESNDITETDETIDNNNIEKTQTNKNKTVRKQIKEIKKKQNQK